MKRDDSDKAGVTEAFREAFGSNISISKRSNPHSIATKSAEVGPKGKRDPAYAPHKYRVQFSKEASADGGEKERPSLMAFFQRRKCEFHWQNGVSLRA